MGLTLNLGVLVVTYSDASGDGTTDTGFVAEQLEKNYAVMSTFYESRKDQIAEWLAKDMANSIRDLAKGRINTGGRKSSASHQVAGQKRTVSGEQSGSLTFNADQKIEAAFRSFIFGGEMQIMMTALAGELQMGGGISAAADAGKSKRFKSGYTKGRKARPAFVDTGLYVSSFRAWVTR